MVMRVLIVGGYGNFGSYIAKSLADDAGIQLLIAGRSIQKASRFIANLKTRHAAQPHAIDIDGDIGAALARIDPHLVIHTTGPFQTQDHRVARACIDQGCHYLDLADARSFVATIGMLDAAAKDKAVMVISGASSVPCLTAAVIDHYLPGFAALDSVDYGISAAQQTNRGLATTSAILSYVGQPFEMLRDGNPCTVIGWQDTHSERYPEIGRRWFGNCDIPDLALFPLRYPQLKSMRFAAGHELAILHAGTWALSWAVRWGLVRSLGPYAERLLRLAFLFDWMGSSRSGFHMVLSGIGQDGNAKTARFFLIARSGHGPYIPCVPAILLTRKLAHGDFDRSGAIPCVDLIGLDDYLDALDGLDISVIADPVHG
jgi:NAD(P)-dependent dehydrogenase (short-subunit alcohol dehydrogenase family)